MKVAVKLHDSDDTGLIGQDTFKLVCFICFII